MRPGDLLLAIVCAGALAACAPARPASAPTAAAEVTDPDMRDGVASIGTSWVRRVGPGEGVLVGRFEGTPYELGLAYGRLNRARIGAQEAQLDRLFRALLPNPLLRAGIRQLSSFRMRRLDRAIPPDLLAAITGLADGYEPVTPAASWPAYRRMLDLHALHELSQRFIDAPGTQYACTGFVASSPATRGGATLLARNFDFEGGSIFDRGKLVALIAERGRIPYLSVGFGGMLGVVSGVNREGLAVAVQSIAGGPTGSSGEPITLVLADILANETTLERAIERLRTARVFVSDSVLLADGKTGRVAIVEKTPHAFAVRHAGEAGWIAAANAPATPAVISGVRPPAGSTSHAREARLVQLLKEKAGALDASASVAILRDGRSASGADLGPGNRNAIDALIAAHSVVFDAGRRRVWVSAAPHTLGAYVPIDLDAVLAAREGAALRVEAPIPEDTYLASGGYDRYVLARRAVVEARRAERRGHAADALARLEEAHRLAPEFAPATALLAERLARAGERKRALSLANEALAREPGPDPFRALLARLRDALASGAPPPAERLAYIFTPDEQIELSAARDLPLAR